MDTKNQLDKNLENKLEKDINYLLTKKIPILIHNSSSSFRTFLKKEINSFIIDINNLEFNDPKELFEKMVVENRNGKIDVIYRPGPLHFLNNQNDFNKDINNSNKQLNYLNKDINNNTDNKKNINIYENALIMIDNASSQIINFLLPFHKNFNFIFLTNTPFNNFNIFNKLITFSVRHQFKNLKIIDDIKSVLNIECPNYQLLRYFENDFLFVKKDIKLTDKIIIFSEEHILKETNNFKNRLEMFKFLNLCFSNLPENLRFKINNFIKESLSISDENINKYLFSILNKKIESFIENDLFLVPTKQTILLTIDILFSIFLKIKSLPILLEGPTGTGKTTIVQRIISHFYKNIEILNCSADIDIPDIIGSYSNENNSFSFIKGPFLESIYENKPILFDEMNLLNDEVLNFIFSIINRNEIFYNHTEINYKESNYKELNNPIFININREGKKNIKFPVLRIFVNSISSDFESVSLVLQSKLKIENKIFNKNELAEFYISNKQDISFRTLMRLIKNRITHLSVYSLTGKIVDDYRIEYDLSNYTNNCINVSLDNNSNSNNDLNINSNNDLNINSNNDLNKDANKYLNTFIHTKNQSILILQLKYLIDNNFPILLTGETSTGKTSLIKYLSIIYKKELIRINNHRDIEKSDYLGHLIFKKNKQYFIEGPLLKAIKNDCWLLIDEINLCSSNILEILNRLLDDNKELIFKNKIYKPGNNFRIFATMNIAYQGRNKLSDAFLDRWVIKNVKIDLEEIVQKIINKDNTNSINFIINIYTHLRMLRNFKCLFTLRDFFKVMTRFKTYNENIKDIFSEYLLNKQRNIESKKMIEMLINDKWEESYNTQSNDIINDNFTINNLESNNTVNNYLVNDSIQSGNNNDDFVIFDGKSINLNEFIKNNQNNFFFSNDHLKILKLCLKALNCKENVLLIGETGIGKTKIVEILGNILNKEIITICCNGSMDTSDLIGQYVVEDESSLDEQKNNVIFRPSSLIQAIKKKSLILLDEINLPDHSVIERLNSLFDSNEIYLTETNELIQSKALIIATMNPGTYAGKKELSDALRNRFTEIYCEFKEYAGIYDFIMKCDNFENLLISESLNNQIKQIILSNIHFLSIRKIERLKEYFKNTKDCIVKREETSDKELICDSLEITNILPSVKRNNLERICDHRIGYKPYYIVPSLRSDLNNINIEDSLNNDLNSIHIKNDTSIENSSNTDLNNKYKENDLNNECIENMKYRISHQFIPKDTNYKFSTYNFFVLLRALNTGKNILIEGNPGIGKTSIIYELGKLLNIPVERVNLSECTEFCDLIGNYVPLNGIDKDNHESFNLRFAFRESPMVQALRKNHIIILDEINLCTQSILEGLNSLFDYRKYIVVNNQIIKSNSIIIGTMNPPKFKGRKTLPRSFLDRFIHIEFFEYDKNEIKNILNDNIILDWYGRVSLRECIRIKLLGLNSVEQKNVKFGIDGNKIKINETVIEKINKEIENESINKNKSHLIAFESNKQNMKIEYPINNESSKSSILDSFVFLSKNTKHVETMINCIHHNIPMILNGMGVTSIIEFVSSIMNMSVNSVYLYEGMDTNDLLGQYVKEDIYKESLENNNKIRVPRFVWKDSVLIESLKKFDITIIYNAELLTKNVLDRLNSLLDSRSLNLIEKGIDTHYKFEKSRLIFKTEKMDFSMPFIDRCKVITMENWTGIDLSKVLWVSQNKETVCHAVPCCDQSIKEILCKNKNCCEFIVNSLKCSRTNCQKKYKKNEMHEECINRIVSTSKNLINLVKIEIPQEKLRNLWLKMKLNTIQDIFNEFVYPNDKNINIIENQDKNSDNAITDKFNLLPNINNESNIRKYFDYKIIKLSALEKKSIKSFHNIQKSIIKDLNIVSALDALKENNKYKIVQSLIYLKSISAIDLKRQFISNQEFRHDLIDRLDESLTENHAKRHKKVSEIKSDAFLQIKDSIMNASLTKLTFSENLFNQLNNIQNLLYKECECLPDIRSILIKMYKCSIYNKKRIQKINNFISCFNSNQEKKNSYKNYIFIKKDRRKSFTAQSLFDSIYDVNYLTILEMLEGINQLKKKYRNLQGYKKILIKEFMKNNSYFNINSYKEYNPVDNKKLKNKEYDLIDNEQFKKIELFHKYIKLLFSYKKKSKKQFTRSFSYLFYGIFFSNEKKDYLSPFIQEQISKNYFIKNELLNYTIKHSREDLIDLTKDPLNHQVLLYLILNEWSIKSLEGFALQYDYLHFLNVIHFIKEIITNHRIINLNKHINIKIDNKNNDIDLDKNDDLDFKNKNNKDSNNINKNVDLGDIRGDWYLLYNFSIQYFSFYRKDSLKLCNNKVNALDFIGEIKEGIERKCYNECDKSIFFIKNELNIEISDNKNCGCLILHDLENIENNLKLKKDINLEDFYKRPINNPYNNNELALGRVFFKFIRNYRENENLKKLILICIEYNLMGLLGNCWKRMEEKENILIDRGSEGGKGDCKGNENEENKEEDVQTGDNDVNENFDGKEEEIDDGGINDVESDNEIEKDLEIEQDKLGSDNNEIEKDNLENKNNESEKDNLEKDNLENDNLENDKLENDKLENDKLENDKLENDNLENDNLEKDLNEMDGSITESVSDENGINESQESENIENESENENLTFSDVTASDLESTENENNTDKLENKDINNENNTDELENKENNTELENNENKDIYKESTFNENKDKRERNEEQSCNEAVNYSTAGMQSEEGKNEKGLKEAENNENNDLIDLPVENLENLINDENNEKENNLQNKIENILKSNNPDIDLLIRLESILFSKKSYQGDYRTGKKLNLKKIFEFIASDYSRDKIWLRKNNQIPIIIRFFIDNSQSMINYDILEMIRIYTLLKKGLEELGVIVEIYKFGTSYIQYGNNRNLNNVIGSGIDNKIGTINSSINNGIKIDNIDSSINNGINNIDLSDFLTFDEQNTSYDFLNNFSDGINLVFTDGIINKNTIFNQNFLFLIFNKKIFDLEMIEYENGQIIRKRYLEEFKNKYEIVDDVLESVLIALEEMVSG